MKDSNLGVFLYNIFLALFKAGVYFASLFDSKAKKWITGRRNLFGKLERSIAGNDKIIWMHCASLGEFEQGRPLWEKLRTDPTTAGFKFLVTFFSPSGYEVQKNYKGADWVFYLPVDGPRNARRFLEIVRPSLVIFVKYEFWYYYLKKIKYRNIPLLLVSALFREDMSFFKWYGGLQRKMLSRFDHLFVQNEKSAKLIESIGLGGICSISGDTRFDRVIEIKEKFEPVPFIDIFLGTSPALVAGSTWKEDEEVLQQAFTAVDHPSFKLILAPHEIDEDHLSGITKLFPSALLYSQLQSGKRRPTVSSVLVIDNIGMLSRLYNYGYITFIGGGFRRTGIHNALEAAVYGKPVLFGPYYQKYPEAVDLVRQEGAISVNNAGELRDVLTRLLKDTALHAFHCKRSLAYVRENKGAAEKIIRFIREKKLLKEG